MNGSTSPDNNDAHRPWPDSTIPSADRAHAERMLSLHRTARPAPDIPDYELLRLIGFGNYGEVWLARNALGSFRAVKVVYRESFDNDRPFEREFQGLQQFEPISHARESQVDIFHVGRNPAAGFFYYVMELADAVKVQSLDFKIEGHTKASRPGLDFESWAKDPQAYIPRTLKYDLRTRGALPVSECLQIGLSLVRALEHLHAHGLVHRDIKPSNIIFVKGVPKLADIGLVTSVDATRSFVGTDGYIPPEGPGTPQADVYSLGKVFYELVTGKDRLDFPELPESWRSQPDLRQLLEFNEILIRACDDDPSRRYQTAAEMAAELALLQSGNSVREDRQRRARWRFAVRLSSIVVGLASLIGVTLGLFRGLSRSPTAQNSFSSINLGRLDDGPDSTNSTANSLYHQAMFLMRGESQQLGEVYTKLTNATQLDPNFAKAYAALFEFGVRERVNTTHEELRQLADKLWELDREMAATHVARSFMEFFDWHYDEAVKECKKAIELNSHYEFAYSHLGMMLTLSGNPNEAQEHLLKALQLEDSKAVIYGMLGCVEFERRNFANAISKNKQALSFKQQYPAAYAWIGRSYQAMTNYLEAINAFQQAEILRGANTNECKALFKELRSAYVDRGERGYWNTLLERTNRKPGIDFYGKAVIYAHLGDTNRALDYLVESYNSREKEDGKFHMVDYLLLDEYWEGLHENPRFKALIRKLGYPNQ